MRCSKIIPTALLLLTLPLSLCADEKVVGKAIFLPKSDGTLQPIYPVRVKVTREDSGKVVQHVTSLSCEVRARVRDVGKGVTVIQTVLKCDDGATYVVSGVIYQGDTR
jgi:hypothetical protein